MLKRYNTYNLEQRDSNSFRMSGKILKTENCFGKFLSSGKILKLPRLAKNNQQSKARNEIRLCQRRKRNKYLQAIL